MQTKYYTPTVEQMNDYKKYLHKSILRLLKLREQEDQNLVGYMESLLCQLGGLNSIINGSSELVVLLTIIEGLKTNLERCSFKEYRKGVLDANALIDKIIK